MIFANDYRFWAGYTENGVSFIIPFTRIEWMNNKLQHSMPLHFAKAFSLLLVNFTRSLEKGFGENGENFFDTFLWLLTTIHRRALVILRQQFTANLLIF